MAILCREHDLLYIRVPATGSSVVARVLQRELGGVSVPRQPVRRNGRRVVFGTHCTVPELVTHGVLSREYVDRCLVVANVRNPFDRWTTYYQRRAADDWVEYSAGVQRRQLDERREEIPDEKYEQRRQAIDWWEEEQKRKGRFMRWAGFDAWMTYRLLQWGWKGAWGNDQGVEEYAFPMLDGVDVVIRQERLDEGLNRVLEIAGVDRGVDLPEKNTTSGKDPYHQYYSWPTRILAQRIFASELKALGYDFKGAVNDDAVVYLDNDQTP